MFEQSFVNTQAQTRKPWTVLASLSLQVAIVVAALIVPLLRIAILDVVPRVRTPMRVESVDLTARPEVKAAARSHPAPSPIIFHPIAFHPPASRSNQRWTPDIAPDAPVLPVQGEGLGGNSLALGEFNVVAPFQPPPEPPKVPVATTQEPRSAPERTVVGGDVQAALLIYAPRPLYPPLARAARQQGSVTLQATIGRDGSVRNLRLLGGPPLLIRSAIDAVRQWRYKPTYLNGEPVEVLTEITVNFTLSR